jgi:hypothetical protein
MRLFGRKKNSVLLLLPLLLGFAFQATQYARAPVTYNYYLVYAKNADVAVRPGTDLSPNGATLLQNSTTQQGFYNLYLGQWGPGYMINYTDAFRIVNREVFDVKLIGFNFTGATGLSNFYIRVQNDTNQDGMPDSYVTVWDGTTNYINIAHYIYLKSASSYGNDGGYTKIWFGIHTPQTDVGLNSTVTQIPYSGELDLWFTSATF